MSLVKINYTPCTQCHPINEHNIYNREEYIYIFQSLNFIFGTSSEKLKKNYK